MPSGRRTIPLPVSCNSAACCPTVFKIARPRLLSSLVMRIIVRPVYRALPR